MEEERHHMISQLKRKSYVTCYRTKKNMKQGIIRSHGRETELFTVTYLDDNGHFIYVEHFYHI